MTGELDMLSARREPARAAVIARKAAAEEAGIDGARAAEMLANESEAYESANREIEGLEADVEAARSEVFSAINAATALRHSLEHAGAAGERVAETLSKLQIESRRCAHRDGAGRRRSRDGIGRRSVARRRRSRRHGVARLGHESELASARTEHEWRARSVRVHEQEIAGLDARLKSLEELEAARAEYGDAARTILAQANGKVGQRGALADYLEVEAGFERAVETYLGDLLQYVIVERPEHAVAGLELVREQSAGRCGFVVAAGAVGGASEASETPRLPLAEIARRRSGAAWSSAAVVGRPDQRSLRRRHPQLNRRCLDCGFVRRRGRMQRHHSGADQHHVRGVVPRRPSDFRRHPARGAGHPRNQASHSRPARSARCRAAAVGAAQRGSRPHSSSPSTQATAVIAALHAEHHRQEKAIVGYDAQVKRANDEKTRLDQKRQQLARERRQFEDERELLDRRQDEARSSIVQIEIDQRSAEEGLTAAQRRLFEARESVQDLARRAADAGAAHAALVERASAVAAEVLRLEEAAVELESRASLLGSELDVMRQRVERLHTAIAESQTCLEQDVQVLDTLRGELQSADEAAATLRSRTESLDGDIRTARGALEAVRGTVGELDVARATAESDLAHLAQSCADAVQASLDEVLAEVEALEQSGGLVADVSVLATDEVDEGGDEMDEAAASRAESDRSKTRRICPCRAPPSSKRSSGP